MKLLWTFLFLVPLFHQAAMQGAKGDADAGSKESAKACTTDPVELGIVLDSSRSIAVPDFVKSIEFLKAFLQQFTIGTGPNDMRVSIIMYGLGIYKEGSFNLTTFKTKQQVIDAIGKITHQRGPFTYTWSGIEYMDKDQLGSDVRKGARKIGLVITDGDSSNRANTKAAAQAARDHGITMIAVGVGAGVGSAELLNIAGDSSRVIQVEGYDELDSIKDLLTKETCVETKPKPKPTPPAKPTCGMKVPTDVYFVFSPVGMGVTGMKWVIGFITSLMKYPEMDVGFKYGVISGSCPEDEGFDLEEYTTVLDVNARLQTYWKDSLPRLLDRLSSNAFKLKKGARQSSRRVAVLIMGEKFDRTIGNYVANLIEDNVLVFIADPENRAFKITGTVTVEGKTPFEQAKVISKQLCTTS